MTLTKEQIRARYFACHIGCDVKPDDDVQLFKIVGISEWEGNIQLEIGNNSDWWNISACQLLLNPLSSITDEHARQLVEMFGCDTDASGSFISLEVFGLHDMKITFEHFGYRIDMTPEHSDLLRSLSYHTGKFMGYDPIAEGWAILDDKNEQK